MRSAGCIGTMTFLAVLIIPVGLAAQDKPDHNNHKHHHYQLIDTGTFGGPESYVWAGTLGGPAQIVKSTGALVGSADTSTPDPFPAFCFNSLVIPFGIGDCFVSHAFQWQEGALTDLGALPGGGSSIAVWTGNNGLISGISQNGETDPLVPGFPENRAVIWTQGQIADLGTFGGHESLGQSGNNKGQVVGVALNATPDPFSFVDLFFLGSSNGTQTRAFLWENGVKQDLGTLGGPDALASYLNEHGQVAGWSYTSYTPNPDTGIPTFHPFLWDKKKGIQDLGTLGGTQVFAQNGLNERGQVIGSMTLADEIRSHPFLWDGKKLVDLGTFGGDHGDAASLNNAGEVVGWAGFSTSCPIEGAGHAFLWRDGVLEDLGTLDGTDNSNAVSINSRTQIVGISFTCDFSVLDAVLWENGSVVDLNTVIPPNSALHLYLAPYINDRGEIAGYGSLVNGDTHAYLLIPCDEYHPRVEGCDYSMVETSATATNPDVRLARRGQNSVIANQAASLLGGTANRLPQPLGGRMMPWRRGLGAQPPASTLIGRSQVSTANGGFSANIVTDYLLGDHTLAPQCWPPWRCHGSCEVNQFGKLTGFCEGSRPPYYQCVISRSNQCPRGARSGHTEVVQCNQIPDRIDTTRHCSF